MKKTRIIMSLLLIFALILTLAACGKKGDSLVGTWEYKEEELGMGAVYVLKDDGTGTYTIIVGDQEVTYELKYEVKDGHLLVRFVNNDIFTDDDLFDMDYTLKDQNTLIINDTSGMEMTFIRK